MNYHLYCDESNIHPKAMCMCIGGLWIPESFVQEVSTSIRLLKEERNIHHELKWDNVSRGYFPVYKALVDIFLEKAELSFRCSVLDKQIESHKKLYDLGIDRAVHDLYVHLISQGVDTENHYWLYVDHRTVGDKTLTLTRLQDDIHKYLQGKESEPVRHVESRNSKTEAIIQLVDVLVGAFAYIPNNPSSTGTAKRGLCDYIASRLGWNSLDRKLPVISQKASVIHWTP